MIHQTRTIGSRLKHKDALARLEKGRRNREKLRKENEDYRRHLKFQMEFLKHQIEAFKNKPLPVRKSLWERIFG